MVFALTAFTAFFISYIITPFIARLAKKQDFVDKPGYRKVHDNAIPNLGGIVIFFGFLLSALFFVPFQEQIKAFLAGSIIILLLGIVDDIVDLKPLNKFIIQLAPALLFIIYHQDTINQFIIQKLSQFTIFGFLLYPVLILWMVGITNSINLIDGLDGLAAGISIISLVTFLIIGFLVDEIYLPYNLLNAALLGSMIAFFRYNFYPAQIFLGDSGSTFSGFLISGSAILLVVYSKKPILLLIPVLTLALPITDTLFAIWRRYKSHTPIFQADRSHLHHRLLDRGISHRNVVLILLALNCICSSLALSLAYFLLKN
ncbi:MAG: undecaprenyl/decaprenyl-phosphate alpha-N-acetylglucosaminyl 1-phosphate transferase [Candidatus Atribacteria bacterium]|nr:undecaprenyl/decaprenyl-phosphate alpha-N-acetylglucosaminyl 1-phosphate transferase [Candidatus Atribacteria bacterium]